MRDLGHCLYCLTARAVHIDHLIPKAVARRIPRAAAERENPRFKVPSCFGCNTAKGTRLRVPVTHANLIPELEAITLGKYSTFDGDSADLHEVVR